MDLEDKTRANRTPVNDANRDPITGAPGSHPVGTGVGAAVGGIAGKGLAEAIDPTSEAAYWRDNYRTRPYASAASFDDYGPAYGYGVSAYLKYPGRSFNDVESDLSRNWNSVRGKSSLGWDGARNATRDAWDRLVNR